MKSPKIDVVKFLEDLGMNGVHMRGEEAWFSCPFEGHSHGDTTQSVSMNLFSGGWNCFGCGRHGTPASFLAELEGISMLRAIRIMNTEYGAPWKVPEDRNELLDRMRSNWREDEPKVLHPISPSELEDRVLDWKLVEKGMGIAPAAVPDAFQYPFKRGLEAETLDEWEFGYDELSDTVCFPYKNREGEVMGLKGRAWRPDEVPKYRVLGDKYGEGGKYGFDTLDVKLIVFGADRIEANGERLVVTEGELNAVAVWQSGIRRVVGISGRYFSPEQARIVKALTDEAVFWYDELTDAVAAARQCFGIRTFVVRGAPSDALDALRFGGPSSVRAILDDNTVPSVAGALGYTDNAGPDGPE